MSKVCAVSGRGPLTGNKRSHSMRATRRKWNVNLQKVRLVVDGKPQTVRVSARALRTLKKQSFFVCNVYKVLVMMGLFFFKYSFCSHSR